MSSMSHPGRRAFRTRFGLQSQVRVALLTILGLLVLATLCAQYLQGVVARYAHRAIDHNARQCELAQQVALEILRCTNCQNQWHAAGGDPALRGKWLVRWGATSRRLVELLDALSACELDAVERGHVSAWREAGHRYRAAVLHLVRHPDGGPTAQYAALGRIADREAMSLWRCLDGVESLANRKMAWVLADGKSMQETLRICQGWILLRGVAAGSVALLGALWFSRRIVRRTQSLTAAISRFGEGDLESRANADVGDELGLLGHQFNEMASQIQFSLERLNREIVHHQETAAELRKAQEAAQTAARVKDEFIANMSHEVRTPLTAILGFAEVLLESVDNPEAVEAARTVKRNGEYLLKVLDGILDLSLIETGKLELRRVPCRPRQLLAEVIALMRVPADAKGLALSSECDGAVPEIVHTDPARLRQILINLLGNAIKFTEAGEVRVVMGWSHPAGEEARLRVDVIDDGIGMTREQLDKLFLPFTQGDSSSRRRFGGNGLGLAVSKRLAKMLGGDITAVSRPKKGSTFTLTIAAGPAGEGASVPAAEDGAETPCPARPAAVPTLRNCRVLLAEDGPDNQRLISFLLKKAGAQVTIAENGQIAVDKILSCSRQWGEGEDGAGQFDVVLMDMQMPVMDGYEATRRLRAHGYPGRIIALTAHAMRGDRQKCLQAGCDDYLCKPINRERLLSTIASLVPTP